MAWPKLVIFDWDGTLFDSIDPIVHGFELSYRSLGHPCPSSEQIRATIGLPLAAAFEQLTPGLPTAAMVTLYRQYWFDPERPPSPWAAGALDTLRWLEAQKIGLAVATGKSRAALHHELEMHALHERFAATRSADDAPPKPHPEMVEQILGQLKTAPEQAILVGDSPLDLAMGRAAGVTTYGVLGGVGSYDALKAESPAAILNSLSCLRSALRKTP